MRARFISRSRVVGFHPASKTSFKTTSTGATLKQPEETDKYTAYLKGTA